MIRQNAGLHGAVLFLMPFERARASGSHVSGACKAHCLDHGVPIVHVCTHGIRRSRITMRLHET